MNTDNFSKQHFLVPTEKKEVDTRIKATELPHQLPKEHNFHQC